MSNSPLIGIKVGNAEVDEIMVYREGDEGWKIDGSKGGEPVRSLDQLQDNFDVVIKVLAEHVDDMSQWTVMPGADEISAWNALVLLVDKRAQADNLH